MSSFQSSAAPSLEAATQALLRARDHVVAALDRQVVELQQLHRALAYAPAPLILTEAAPQPTTQAPASPLVRLSAGTKSAEVFEQAPRANYANSPAPARHSESNGKPLPMPSGTSAAVAVEAEPAVRETALDPALERATLEELNAALASAFASVAARRKA